jgi:L-galactono-1,4-lactone dehydrogenase
MQKLFTSALKNSSLYSSSRVIAPLLKAGGGGSQSGWNNGSFNSGDQPFTPWLFFAVPPLLFLALKRDCVEIADCEQDPKTGVEYNTDQSLTNWSLTHSCSPKKIYEPKSAQQVLRLLQQFHQNGEKVRPIGSGLSPNGLGMSNVNLLSVHALDSIVVDPVNQLVTVGAGARVSDVLKELKKFNLTLDNFSSIQEQQMAGWTQVAAHGTGCFLPTVDEMIVRMQLATPTEGLLTLSKASNPNLFAFAKVGLGALGVVTELTLKCIPRHSLLEHTYTASVQTIGDGHYERLANYRHVRYMWLPYTGRTVVVVSNPVDPKTQKPINSYDPAGEIVSHFLENNQEFLQKSLPIKKPFIELLASIHATFNGGRNAQTKSEFSAQNYENYSFTQLRDELIEISPLNVQHIAAINREEAKCWQLSTGSRIDDSTNILGFDCGGEQFVYEICFPIGTLKEMEKQQSLQRQQRGGSVKQPKDLEFIGKLLNLIEKNRIPAPSPIEHRWTARSTSKMSPAYSENPDEIFAWVGIIMYIPRDVKKKILGEVGAKASEEAEAKDIQLHIKEQFQKYMNLIQPLCREYSATAHWAKIEIPQYIALSDKEKVIQNTNAGFFSWIWNSLPGGQQQQSSSSSPSVPLDSSENLLLDLRQRLGERYPLQEFHSYRTVLDPKRVLSNELVDTLLTPLDPKPLPAPQQKQKK